MAKHKTEQTAAEYCASSITSVLPRFRNKSYFDEQLLAYLENDTKYREASVGRGKVLFGNASHSSTPAASSHISKVWL